MGWNRFVLSLAATAFMAANAKADPLPGPIPAEVLEVVDGDSIRVKARIWIGQTVDISVRLAEVDAPELGRAKCAREREKGELARRAVTEFAGSSVRLRQIGEGKYAGRVVAFVESDTGEDLSSWLLAQGLAIPYGAPKPWCLGA